MKLAIMQPYFFPYLGYFSLINSAEKWIVLDDVQYIRHGWVARNRILKPTTGWQYINVPIEKHSQSTLIRDIKINNSEDWKQKIIRQIEHYKKVAPFYSEVIQVLNFVFEENYTSISKLNTRILQEICRYIGISFNYQVFSEMNLDVGIIKEAGDWALNISKVMKASEYINPNGGKHIFNLYAFQSEGIKITFLEPNLISYNQGSRSFEPALSIIDVMMFNSTEKICKMINSYQIT